MVKRNRSEEKDKDICIGVYTDSGEAGGEKKIKILHSVDDIDWFDDLFFRTFSTEEVILGTYDDIMEQVEFEKNMKEIGELLLAELEEEKFEINNGLFGA